MTRTLPGLGAALLLLFSTTQAAAPEREVRGNRLISKRDPAVTITVPRSAKYLGAERWDLYGIADAELHLFVEAARDKTVKKLYWIQFEQYLPDNTRSYDYTRDEAVTAWGRPFWQRARFGETGSPPREGSDGERMRQMLARAGLKMPAESMNVRLVNLLDDSNRKELMFIYAEDLADTGHSAASLMDGDEPKPEWKALERDLVDRAMKSFRVDWTR